MFCTKKLNKNNLFLRFFFDFFVLENVLDNVAVAVVVRRLPEQSYGIVCDFDWLRRTRLRWRF